MRKIQLQPVAVIRHGHILRKTQENDECSRESRKLETETTKDESKLTLPGPIQLH